MIVVTGAGGFIGSQLARNLNADGITDLITVDIADSDAGYGNLTGVSVDRYCAADELPQLLQELGRSVSVIYHLGACSDTTNYDREYMFGTNFEYSKRVAEVAIEFGIPLVYASSAAVYGNSQNETERILAEAPANVYAESKLAFDEYCRALPAEIGSTLVGLRFFNVYGPGEFDKGRMASTAYQFYRQIESGGVARLFGAVEGIEAGEQLRDFVSVADVIRVCRFFGEGQPHRGIFDVGTGRARSFKELASIVIDEMGAGRIEYIDFPDSLRGKYQFFTQANLKLLREIGFTEPFADLEQGLAQYVGFLRG